MSTAKRRGWKWASKEARSGPVVWLVTKVKRQIWDKSEWWQQRAQEVGGECGKCRGMLHGVYSVLDGGRVVNAHCWVCGNERAVLMQEAGGRPFVP